MAGGCLVSLVVVQAIHYHHSNDCLCLCCYALLIGKWYGHVANRTTEALGAGEWLMAEICHVSGGYDTLTSRMRTGGFGESSGCSCRGDTSAGSGFCFFFRLKLSAMWCMICRDSHIYSPQVCVSVVFLRRQLGSETRRDEIQCRFLTVYAGRIPSPRRVFHLSTVEVISHGSVYITSSQTRPRVRRNEPLISKPTCSISAPGEMFFSLKRLFHLRF